MMASAQVVETSVNTNNSPSQDYTTNPDDHSNHNIDSPGFKPFTVIRTTFGHQSEQLVKDYIRHETTVRQIRQQLWFNHPLMMASAQVVETSINTNNSPSQAYNTNPDDHSNHNIDSPGFKPFTVIHKVKVKRKPLLLKFFFLFSSLVLAYRV